jgi:hypothetical protein
MWIPNTLPYDNITMLFGTQPFHQTLFKFNVIFDVIDWYLTKNYNKVTMKC